MSAETSNRHDSGMWVVLFLGAALAVFVTACIVSVYRSHVYTGTMRCERSAEWVVCTEVRIPAAEIVKVASVRNGSDNAKIITVVTNTGKQGVRVADRWFESSMKALVPG